MLPYTQVQLAYALAVLIASIAFWRATARVPTLVAHPRWRTIAIALGFGLAGALNAIAFDSGFAAVAVLFYAGASACPA